MKKAGVLAPVALSLSVGCTASGGSQALESDAGVHSLDGQEVQFHRESPDGPYFVTRKRFREKMLAGCHLIAPSAVGNQELDIQPDPSGENNIGIGVIKDGSTNKFYNINRKDRDVQLLIDTDLNNDERQDRGVEAPNTGTLRCQ